MLADETPVIADFARIWRGADKVVYPATLEQPASTRTRIVRTFDPDEVRAMKASSSGDLSIDPTAGEELWIIDATSGARRRLATGLAWRGGSPAWSPDATAIAFERDGDIWSVDLATGTETQRTRTDDRETDPAWGASPSRSTSP
jgi:hypothetical protein